MAKLERIYIVPLRRVWQRVPPYRRAPRAVKALRDFLERHMKSDNVKLGLHLNNLLWSRGKKSPPHKVKVNAVKEEDGTVKAELFGKDMKETFEINTEEKQEKKEAEKKEAKEQKKEEKKEAKQETSAKAAEKKEEKPKIQAASAKQEVKAEKKPEAKIEKKSEIKKTEPKKETIQLKKPAVQKKESEKTKITQKTLV